MLILVGLVVLWWIWAASVRTISEGSLFVMTEEAVCHVDKSVDNL